MEGPMIFQFIGAFLDTALNAFVSQTAGNVITMFTLFALGGTTLYLTVMGYMIGWGYIEAPMSTFLKTCAKLILIAAFALNADMYMEWIVGGIRSLEVGFTSAFAGTGSSGGEATSVYQLVDHALGRGWGIAGDLWERAANRDWSEIGMAFGEYFNAGIIAVATGLLEVTDHR